MIKDERNNRGNSPVVVSVSTFPLYVNLANFLSRYGKKAHTAHANMLEIRATCTALIKGWRSLSHRVSSTRS